MKTRLTFWLSALVIMQLVIGDASAQDCHQSSIFSPSPFLGNNDEIFKLADGSLWQVKYEYQYLYAYSPSVTICPGRGKLIIGGKSLNVRLVSGSPNQSSSKRSASETSIAEVSNDGSIVRLSDGSIYDIDAVGQIKTMLWLPGQKVLKQTNKLLNVNKGQSVGATPLK